jgi:hypothetical protein
MFKLGVFVSDTGQLLDVRPGELQWVLKYPKVDFNLSSYAIRNLGFVWFKPEANGARLKLRADLFSRACFERVVRLVVEHRLQRLIIEHEDGGQPIEILTNVNDIIARLDFLRGTSATEAPRENFIIAGLDLGRLRHPKRYRMSEMFTNWVRTRGRLPRHFDPHKRGSGFEGGHLLVSLKGRDQAIIQTWPTNITCYSPCQSIGLIGRGLADQPDGKFAEWSSKPYHEVVSQSAARLDLVEAVIRTPGRPALISRYERLLLPWRTGTGGFWVSGTSLTRSRRLLKSAI